MNTFEILTVTLVLGSKLKMINASSGSSRLGSFFVSCTPVVYSTQNGSKLVGAALGDAEGWLLGDTLGELLGFPLGYELGDPDGDDDGEDDG